MKKIIIYQSITDGQDGAPHIGYFLTYKEANKDQDEAKEEGWNYAETIIEEIETYEGSNIHKLALEK